MKYAEAYLQNCQSHKINVMFIALNTADLNALFMTFSALT